MSMLQDKKETELLAAKTISEADLLLEYYLVLLLFCYVIIENIIHFSSIKFRKLFCYCLDGRSLEEIGYMYTYS